MMVAELFFTGTTDVHSVQSGKAHLSYNPELQDTANIK